MRATLVVLLVAPVLSAKYLLGKDLGFLVVGPEAFPGEPWRFVTTCFLHGDVLHLAFNMYWIWQFGRIVEPSFGLPATLGIYLLLLAGPAAAEWGLMGPGIGLSGLGYGLFGLLWALGKKHPDFRGAISEQIVALFVLWFLACIVTTYLGVFLVANVAHGAGALLGAMLGWTIAQHGRARRLWMAATILACAAIAAAATVARPFVHVGYSGEGRIDEWRNAADRAFSAGDPARAQRFLERVVAEDPRDAIGWYNLGVARAQQGAHADALAAYERAIGAAASDAMCRDAFAGSALLFAREVLDGGDARRARQVLERAVEVAPRSADCWEMLGWACENTGDLTRARAAYGRALEEEPGRSYSVVRLSGLEHRR